MIRIATTDDTEKILEIYSYYVINTAVTFEYDVPTAEEFRKRIAHTLEKYPYIVYEENGKIYGYAYADPFKERSAYNWAVETTIYVAPDLKRNGIGKALYLQLEKILALQKIINLNACIGYPVKEDEYLTQDSVNFHQHMGYKIAGQFYKCGYKFGRWYDMVWMEKCISNHPEKPEDIICFPLVKDLIDNEK